MKKQQIARPIAHPTTIARRPPRARSTSGPSKGPTMRNGATVRPSERATLDSAAFAETSKKTDPARAIATNASPAEDRPCTVASRRKGVSFTPAWSA